MSLDSLPAYRSGLPHAVDVMGGDNGFEIIVEGAIQALKDFGVRSILVGPKEKIESFLQAQGAANVGLGVYHASQEITMEDSPGKAVRRKPDASLCVAFNLVQAGQAASVLSAGNSGAMMAAGRMICGLLPGIERPAIATLIPNAGEGGIANVVLDSGANIDCHAHHLVQFAVMGSIYHTALFGKKRPRVAILSNGGEPSKGNDMTRGAATMLAEMDLVDYIGYIEGRDVATDKADVIVCDGFVGNVLLKSMEGCVKLILNQLLHESKKGIFRRVGLALSKGMLKEIFTGRFDYTSQGGAPLLGLRKLGIVLHGSSDVKAVKNAIRVADNFVANKMTDEISIALSHLEDSLASFKDDFYPGVFGKDSSQSLKKQKAVEE